MQVFAILIADRAVITPQPVDAGPGFFENRAQFRDNGVRRTVDDPGNLLFECRPAARALRPSDRELDEVAAKLRRKIARRVRPCRMREASELACIQRNCRAFFSAFSSLSETYEHHARCALRALRKDLRTMGGSWHRRPVRSSPLGEARGW